MQLAAGPPEDYLGEDDVIRWSGGAVERLARDLRRAHPDDAGFAAAAYTFTRDRVAHSWDAADRRVTLSSEEVLAERVGLCHGKAHLLAALLRSQGVPTGLCYQRLADDDGATFVLHGLVAVYLRGGWHRQDPRGNKAGVDAQFSLAGERLAWPVRPEHGEIDHPRVFAAPDDGVVASLRAASDMLALCAGGLPADLAET
jgi:transglutaminase-like putative cysteine protease